jgi:hypothetical protein
MGSDVVIYVPSLIKTGSAIQNLIRRYTHTDTQRQPGDRVSLVSFLKIRKVG